MLELGLERYVAGVVAGETTQAWPDEALRAQAVACRSYAIHRLSHPRHRRYHVTADTLDQCFHGGPVPDRVRAQVARTEHEYLTSARAGRRSSALRTLFHTACGGRTDDPVVVWSTATAIEHHRAVDCPQCRRSPHHWQASIGSEELAALVGLPASRGVQGGLEVVERTPSGRAAAVRLSAGEAQRIVSADELRAMVGYGRVRSARFDVSRSASGTVLRGTGLGHGVGLCKRGALGMAAEGKTYREILDHYYAGSRLVSLAAGSTGKKPRSGGIRSRARLLSSRR